MNNLESIQLFIKSLDPNFESSAESFLTKA
jgi:hypothetical protein